MTPRGYIFGFVLAASLCPPALATPERVVSINLCADELVIPLGDRNTIKSVSYLSADPEESPVADEAKDLPVNYARAEEILPLKPDIVFANRFSAAYTVNLLRRLGVNVIELPNPTDFDGIRANVRRVAELLGHPERGEAMIRDFNAALAEAKMPEGAARPLAVVYRAGGYTDGGTGLSSEILAHLGLRNMSEERGLKQWDHLSVEQLLLDQPDIVVVSAYRQEAPSEEAAVLEHPALRTYLATHRSIAIPAKYWGCGTPAIAEAAKRLSALLRGNKPQ